MIETLAQAIVQAEQLPAGEQHALAAILIEEMASEQRWTRSFAQSADVLESMAADALAELKAGRTEPLASLL